MKMRFLAALAAIMILTLTGCGGHDNDASPLFSTEILSDSTFDGDVKRDLSTGIFTVAQGSVETQQRVFSGLDPFSAAEYRSFLHFSLTGVNGVPGDAIIESAFIEIFINHIDIQFPANSIPMRIDLVSFPQPLIETDFDLPAQAVPARFPIFLTDSGGYVTIDVTSLMTAAQRLRYSDFQVRIMEELGDVPLGLIEINDTTGGDRSIFAPLLTVNYF